MFNYLFCSFEQRSYPTFRSILHPAWAHPNTNVSEPTYQARTSYKNADYVRNTLYSAYKKGVNLIRVDVEAAVQFMTTSYIDPADGIEYPSDIDMLDTIISIAGEYKIVVQLTSANDGVPQGSNGAFLTWIATKYASNPYVWINPANELNGMLDSASHVNDPGWWIPMQASYVWAIRIGTGFKNPIVLDPPGYATRLDLVANALKTLTPFKEDGNIIIGVHFYPIPSDANWKSAGLQKFMNQWVTLTPQFCVIMGEVGFNNYGINYDPNLNGPSADPAAYARLQSTLVEFFQWCKRMEDQKLLQGGLIQLWYAYLPGMGLYDYNTMTYMNGDLTAWGELAVNNMLSPKILIPSFV